MKMKVSAIFKAILFLTLIHQSIWAQETDSDFEALLNEPPPSAEPAAANGGGQSINLYTEDVKKENFAFYGFSMGFVMTTQTYQPNAELYDPTTKKNLMYGQDFPEYLNTGILLRYAVLPVNGVGTDINVSYMTSTNHGGLPGSPPAISTLRAELNLGYTLGLNKGMKLYVLGGAGIHNLEGTTTDSTIPTVNDVMAPLGYGVQAGIGFNFSSINIDFMYSIYRNRISTRYNELYAVQNAGHFFTNESFIESKGLVGRASYRF